MKMILLGLLCGFSVACETSNRPPMSAVPDAQASAVYREPGVGNTPRNSGNPPSDLRPGSPQSQN